MLHQARQASADQLFMGCLPDRSVSGGGADLGEQFPGVRPLGEAGAAARSGRRCGHAGARGAGWRPAAVRCAGSSSSSMTLGRWLQTGSMSQPAARACRARVTMSPYAAAALPWTDHPRTLPPETPALRAARRESRRGEAGGGRIDRREEDMGHHDGRKPVGDQPAVGGELRARSARGRRSTGRVRCESATTAPCPGKCLAVAAMPASRIPCIQAMASWATASAARMEGALADGLAHPVIEVHAGGKGDVDPMGAQLRGHQPAERARRGRDRPRIEVELVADAACRGQAREAARKRCTRPPSWSTATISGGARAAWIAATRAPSWAGST